MPYQWLCGPVVAIVWFLSPIAAAQEAAAPAPKSPDPAISMATMDTAAAGLSTLISGTLEPWLGPAPWLTIELPVVPTAPSLTTAGSPDVAVVDDGSGRLRAVLEKWQALGPDGQRRVLSSHALRRHAFSRWQQDTALLASWSDPLPQAAEQYLLLARQVTALAPGRAGCDHRPGEFAVH